MAVFLFSSLPRLGRSASQVGAATTLQDIAQALLGVLGPAGVLKECPSAKQPEVEAPGMPTSPPTAAVEPGMTTSGGLAEVTPPPSGTPPATPLAPTQVEAPSVAPSGIDGEPLSTPGADIEDAPTEPGDFNQEALLTKNDLKATCEGVLACHLCYLLSWLVIPHLSGEGC